MRKLLTLFLAISLAYAGHGQTQDSESERLHKLDSLRILISEISFRCPAPCAEDTNRIDNLLQCSELHILSNLDSSLEYSQQALSLAENLFKETRDSTVKIVALKQKAIALNNIGYIWNMTGDDDKSLLFFEQSLKIKEELGDKMGMAYSLNNIGYIHNNNGNLPKAFEYYNRSLKIREEIDDKKGIGYALNNIASLYSLQGDLKKAGEYYARSLAIWRELENKYGISNLLNNIGYIDNRMADEARAAGLQNECDSLEKSAIRYYQEALVLQEEIEDLKGIGSTLNNIGSIYQDNGDHQKALEYYYKSLDFREKLGHAEGIAISKNNIGECLFDLGRFEEALTYANQSYALASELGYPDEIKDAAFLLSKIFRKNRDFEKALNYYEEYVAMMDSLSNRENRKQIQQQYYKYQYEKKAATDSVAYSNAIQIKDLELAKTQEEKEKQQILIYSFVAGFIVILLFSIIILRLFMQKKKANVILARKNYEINQQKEEISAQRDEIEAQRDEVQKQKEVVELQKEEIEDSIEYAKRIQTAVLPSLDRLFQHGKEGRLLDYFILFQPKDVVSGDFYWATRINEWFIVTVADCTGHGVPGAFMSMLGVSFLNDIVRKKEVTDAAMVLNHLRNSVIEALKQRGEIETFTEESGMKDGMDMSLIAIHEDKKSALWAGANNPLYIIRKGNINNSVESENQEKIPDHTGNDNLELIEYKPDKMPVSIHLKMDSFTNHRIELSEGDRIYLFTDGFADQFGGPKGKKLKYATFKNMLCESYGLTMKDQGEYLKRGIENWMLYEGKFYEQIDDITVAGIEI